MAIDRRGAKRTLDELRWWANRSADPRKLDSLRCLYKILAFSSRDEIDSLVQSIYYTRLNSDTERQAAEQVRTSATRSTSLTRPQALDALADLGRICVVVDDVAAPNDPGGRG